MSGGTSALETNFGRGGMESLKLSTELVLSQIANQLQLARRVY